MKTWQLLKKDPSLFPRYYVKEYIIKACRKYFEHKNYHELESPIITSALPQERYLDVLETNIELRNKTVKGYIVPTTETFNKKILAAGLGNHFVITKVVRGLEEISPNHSPEFTMMEWYELGENYKWLMDDCENLIIFVLKFLDLAKTKSLSQLSKLSFEEIESHQCQLKLKYKNQEIDFNKGWYRISIPDKVKEVLGVELSEIYDYRNLLAFAKNRGYKVSEQDDWQLIFELLFTSEIENTIPQDKPVFIYNYPKIMCPLTKENSENPLVCEKVELYIAGKEVANGYTELLDGEEQEKRFLIEQQARKELGLKEIAFDHDLVNALKSGMPEVAGIGMGLDRVAMIFANANYISEINYFPASEMFED